MNPEAAPALTNADALPVAQGHFGVFGGRFVPETLMPALEELEGAYGQLRGDGVE